MASDGLSERSRIALDGRTLGEEAVTAKEITCPKCSAAVAELSNAFCVVCGHRFPGSVPGTIGNRKVAAPRVRQMRLSLAVLGFVLITVGTVALFVPFMRLQGRSVSIWAAHDVCSVPFLSAASECTVVNVGWFAAIAAIVLAFVLIFVGLHGRSAGGERVNVVVSRTEGASPEATKSSRAPEAPRRPATALDVAQVTSAWRSFAGGTTRPSSTQSWLLGVGAAVGALSFLLPWVSSLGYPYGYTDTWGFSSVVNLLVAMAMVGVAVSVFLPDRFPTFAHRSLAVLVAVLVGLGMGLNELSHPSPGFGVIVFFLAMLGASVGAVSLEASSQTVVMAGRRREPSVGAS